MAFYGQPAVCADLTQPLLGRVATVNDVHFGEVECGYCGGTGLREHQSIF